MQFVHPSLPSSLPSSHPPPSLLSTGKCKGQTDGDTFLRVFAGSEAFLLRTLRAGGQGCISATANVNPSGIVEVRLPSLPLPLSFFSLFIDGEELNHGYRFSGR